MRRNIFTTLALASFVFVVQSAYRETLGFWVGLDGSTDMSILACTPKDTQGMDTIQMCRATLWNMRPCWVIACLALLPTLLLAASDHNAPSKAARDPWLLLAGALITGALVCATLLGDRNGMPVATHAEWSAQMDVQRRVVAIRTLNHISALWLLLPTILASAFVIFGAWRRRASST